jgi:hypothetical protein
VVLPSVLVLVLHVLSVQLPLDCVRKPEFWPDYHPSVSQPSSHVPKQGTDYPVNTLLDVAGSRVVLGKPADFPSFGFDNEYGVKAIEVGVLSRAVPC